MKSHDRKKIKWNKNGIDAKKMNSTAIEIEKEGESADWMHTIEVCDWAIFIDYFAIDLCVFSNEAA